MSALFEGLQLGELRLKHRVVLAPLTRFRADRKTLVPTELMKEYYTQRATEGGLLITEATCISPEGLPDNNVPGIWTKEQTQGWKKIVDSVHAKGGLISVQLWHTGRMAHETMRDHPMADPERLPTVSASDVTAPGKTGGTLSGEIDTYSKPRPLREDEIPRLLEDYKRAARNAREAGFDAVELHAAHGYLIDQFLNDNTNKRSDKYGGSIENRCRLLREAVEAISEEMPLSRVGVRISPQFEGTMRFFGASDSNPLELYTTAIKTLDQYNLAYLLLTEPRWFGGKFDKDHSKDPGFSMGLYNPSKFRHLYRGPIIGAGGFTPLTAPDAVHNGHYDAIGFGRWFISNPDLVHRIQQKLPLNKYVRETFYKHGSPDGYVDYPFYEDADKSALVPQEKIGASLESAKL
ncbi:12-oxophytodienoate reductase-like protein [Hondaea fermentalgiana]|uniref:12-oxophytodienoate reductase-like protein n=1 Tax=Hondaea fermentalgiana TaxID=2315210 RepID=A0A2R5GDI5_9STRA|nr:12-oxophytodienoate reductase-like protein [Hondaea fermentalgiana]|eukprot:GBG29012.1 12-oxophytodienoate reductase-like protein [Hondaea fermentalgiana]